MLNKKFVYKDRRQGLSDANYWWHETRRREIPFVAVRRGSRYAEIWFDYMTLDRELEIILRANEETVVEGLFEIFRKYQVKKSGFSCRSAVIPCFEKIPIANAQACAEEMFDFICEFLGLGQSSPQSR